MNGKKRSIFQWNKEKKTPAELLQDEAQDEAILLERDILEKELAMIDAKFKIQAQKAKKAFIASWLLRPEVEQPGSVRDILHSMAK